MSRVLDFNLYRRLTMIIIFKDEKKTILHLCAPVKSLTDKIQQILPDLQVALSGNNGQASFYAIYDLAADLISCNLDGITVTPDELAKKFEMNLEDMLLFFERYLEFLEEIRSEKN